MAEYIPNWKGLEAYHFTGSNQAELKTQVEKNGGSTYTDDYGNFYLVIDKTKYFMPPNYVLVINEKRAGKLYKKADFDANYKDYSGGGGSGTDITAGEGIKVSATGEVSADFDVLAKKEDLDKNVFVAVYNQTTAQELLDYLATTNKPYAPIVVERGGQYYTAILSFKQNDETAYIRILGSASGEYTIFNHSIKGRVWGTETTILQKKIDLTKYYTKTETDAKIAEGIAGFDKLDYKIVDALPATGEAGVRYLVKIPRKKSFEEWIYITDEWHNIGTTSDINLDNYYTKTETEAWVESKGYLTEHQDLSDYATQIWVESKGYLTEHQDISNLATKTELNTKQDKLISGDTIKSINNTSLLGSGNIETPYFYPITDALGERILHIIQGRYSLRLSNKDNGFTILVVDGEEHIIPYKEIPSIAFLNTELAKKQDKLTAGEGIVLENNNISADISSAFKFVQKNANGITIPANTRTNVIVADILETPYQIAGFRQIGILKGDGGDDIGWKNCVIQSYSTTNVGKSAQVQVRNTGATEAIINVSVNVLAFKKTS